VTDAQSLAQRLRIFPIKGPSQTLGGGGIQRHLSTKPLIFQHSPEYPAGNP
jgi:hypothetical protein